MATNIPAVVLHKPGHPYNNFELETIPKPAPGAGQLLVHVKATALNPVDYKMAQYGFMLGPLPVVLGCDFAGVVEAVGHEVKDFKVGDEVFGFPGLGNGGGYHRGTFSTHIVVNAKVVFRKPKNISFEQASTYGVAAGTAALALFETLKLPYPQSGGSKASDTWVLIWGGTSSVGTFAVQLAALAGFNVVAAASKKNFDFVKSLGAKAVVDYASPTAVEEIKKITNNQLYLAVDTVGAESAAQAAAALSSDKPSQLAGIAGTPKEVPAHVKVHNVVLGSLPDSPEGIATIGNIIKHLQPLYDAGKVRPSEVQPIPEGLKGIRGAMQLLSENKVSGKKLVATL